MRLETLSAREAKYDFEETDAVFVGDYPIELSDTVYAACTEEG